MGVAATADLPRLRFTRSSRPGWFLAACLLVAACSSGLGDGEVEGDVDYAKVDAGDTWESLAARIGCDASDVDAAGALLRSANPLIAEKGLAAGQVVAFDRSHLPEGCGGAARERDGAVAAGSQDAGAGTDEANGTLRSSSDLGSDAGGARGDDGLRAGGADGFVETFDTPESMDRFDYAVHHAWTAQDTDETWIGDHDMNCGPPEPGRTIDNPTRVDDGTTYYADVRDPVVFWCREHLMTTFNTNHYAQVDFAPKQTFEDVTRVCWRQNRTDLGGRMWTQLVIVPLATYESNDGRFDYVASRFSPEGPGKYGIHATDETLLVEIGTGDPRVQVGQRVDDGGGSWDAGSDKATRYQICVEDSGRDLEITFETDEAPDVYRREGRIPSGPVKVIFQHDLYNPDKDPGVSNGYTVHWDDLIIDSA